MVGSVGSLLATLGVNDAPFNAGLARAEARLSRSGRAMSRVTAGAAAAAKATGLIALPLVALGVAGVMAAGKYESALSQAAQASGASARVMKQLDATALKLGNDIRIPGASAADAAQAMTELAKGGFTAREAMDAARGTLTLAAAAGMENAEAAKLQARTLKAFGLSAKDAGHVADVLAGAANRSTADISEMGMALQQSSAVARQHGMTVTQTATAIAQLANAGIAGSDAGTSLKTMLLALNPQTKKAKEAMKDLGVSTYDAHGKMKPFPTIVGDFSRALKGMSDKQRDAALQTIFGNDAIRAAFVTMTQGEGAFNRLAGAIGKQGNAADAARAKVGPIQRAIDAVSSVAATTAIVVGRVLGPAFESLAGQAGSAIQAAQEWVTANQAMLQANVAAVIDRVSASASRAWPLIQDGARALIDVVTEIGPAALDAFDTLVNAASTVAPLLIAIAQAGASMVSTLGGGGLLAAGVAMYAFAKAAALASAAMAGIAARGGIIALLSGLANPVALATVAVGALAFASYRLATAQDQVTSSARGLVNALQAVRNASEGAVDADDRAARAKLAVTRAQIDVKRASSEVTRAIRVQQAAAKDGSKTDANSRAANERVRDAILSRREAEQNLKEAQTEQRRASSDAAAAHKKVATTSDEAREAARKNVAEVTKAPQSYNRWAAGINKAGSEQRKAARDVDKAAEALRGQAKAAKDVDAPVRAATEKIASVGKKTAQLPDKLIELGIKDVQVRTKVPAAQRLIDGMHGKTVYVDVVTRQKGSPVPAPGGGSGGGTGGGSGGGGGGTGGGGTGPDAYSAGAALFGRSNATSATLATWMAQQGAKARPVAYKAGKDAGNDLLMGYLDGTRQLPEKMAEKTQRVIDGVKSAIERARGPLDSAFDRMSGDALRAFDARTDQLLSRVEARYDKMAKNAAKSLDKLKAAAQAALDVKLGGIERSRSEMTPAEQALADMEAAHDAASAAQALAQAQADLNKAAAEHDQEGINQAQQRINDLLYEQSLAAIRKQADAERAAKDAAAAAEAAAAQAAFDAEISRLEAEDEKKTAQRAKSMEKEKRELQARRDLRKRHLEDMLEDQKRMLERGETTWEKAHARLMKLFKDDFGPGMKTAGENLGHAFATGMREAFDDVEKTAKAVAALVAKYLKLNSPAEKGPLSSLDSWWRALGPTLARGVDTPAVHGVGAQAAAAALAGGPYANRTGGGAGGPTIVVNVHGSVIAERDLAEVVRDQLLAFGRRNTTIFAGRA